MNTIMIVVLAAVLLSAVAVGVYLLLSNSGSENKGPVVKINQGNQNQVVDIKDYSVYNYYEPTPQEIGPVGVMSECNDPNIDMEDTSTMTEFLSNRNQDKEKFQELLLGLTRSGVLLYREDGTQVTMEDVINNIISSRMNRFPQVV